MRTVCWPLYLLLRRGKKNYCLICWKYKYYNRSEKSLPLFFDVQVKNEEYPRHPVPCCFRHVGNSAAEFPMRRLGANRFAAEYRSVF